MLFGTPRPNKTLRIWQEDGKALRPSDPFPFLKLPLELQEKIFEQALLDENSMAWEWPGEFFAPPIELCLSSSAMRPPVLARVSRQLRADVLACLFRTTIFRIEPDLQETCLLRTEPTLQTAGTAAIDRALFTEHFRKMSWLRLLHGRQEGGIRRLQFRLPIPDCTGKKANLNLQYMAGPRRWRVELVPDCGFESADGGQRRLSTGPAPPKPAEYEIKILRKLLIAVSPASVAAAAFWYFC